WQRIISSLCRNLGNGLCGLRCPTVIPAFHVSGHPKICSVRPHIRAIGLLHLLMQNYRLPGWAGDLNEKIKQKSMIYSQIYEQQGVYVIKRLTRTKTTNH